jgi:hypothetical protein
MADSQARGARNRQARGVAVIRVYPWCCSARNAATGSEVAAVGLNQAFNPNLPD